MGKKSNKFRCRFCDDYYVMYDDLSIELDQCIENMKAHVKSKHPKVYVKIQKHIGDSKLEGFRRW